MKDGPNYGTLRAPRRRRVKCGAALSSRATAAWPASSIEKRVQTVSSKPPVRAASAIPPHASRPNEGRSISSVTPHVKCFPDGGRWPGSGQATDPKFGGQRWQEARVARATGYFLRVKSTLTTFEPS